MYRTSPQYIFWAISQASHFGARCGCLLWVQEVVVAIFDHAWYLAWEDFLGIFSVRWIQWVCITYACICIGKSCAQWQRVDSCKLAKFAKLQALSENINSFPERRMMGLCMHKIIYGIFLGFYLYFIVTQLIGAQMFFFWQWPLSEASDNSTKVN